MMMMMMITQTILPTHRLNFKGVSNSPKFGFDVRHQSPMTELRSDSNISPTSPVIFT